VKSRGLFLAAVVSLSLSLTVLSLPASASAGQQKLSASERQQINETMDSFVNHVVKRQNIDAGYDSVTPAFRLGMSRKEWDKGALPVIPYPALDRGWGYWSFVQYSYIEAKQHTVGLEVFLFPKPKSGWSAMTADVEVVHKPKGRWLVDYWMPKKFHGPPAVAQAPKVKTNAQKLRERHAQKAKAAESKDKEQASAPIGDQPLARGAWWALPLGILGLAILIPLTIGMFVWYRNRKAERAYFRSAGDGNSGSDT